MGALDEGPRFMPPEPMPWGGPAGAGRDGAGGGRGEGPRDVLERHDAHARHPVVILPAVVVVQVNLLEIS